MAPLYSAYLDLVKDLVENNQAISTKMGLNKMFHCVCLVFWFGLYYGFSSSCFKSIRIKRKTESSLKLILQQKKQENQKLIFLQVANAR